jgi:transcriptional regulator with XRE-family HTH domain
MSIFTDEDSQSLPEVGLDLGVFGQRLRHFRRLRGLTLAELGARVGRAPSVLSLLENGRREPKLSLIEALAGSSRPPPRRRLARPTPTCAG